jgi:hypothetical protein
VNALKMDSQLDILTGAKRIQLELPAEHIHRSTLNRRKVNDADIEIILNRVEQTLVNRNC